MSEIESCRQRLHAAISSETPFGQEEDPDVPDAGVLTGWVLVAEWQGSDGNRWLSKLSGDAMGERRLPSWSERGFCQEVVFHWPEDQET